MSPFTSLIVHLPSSDRCALVLCGVHLGWEAWPKLWQMFASYVRDFLWDIWSLDQSNHIIRTQLDLNLLNFALLCKLRKNHSGPKGNGIHWSSALASIRIDLLLLGCSHAAVVLGPLTRFLHRELFPHTFVLNFSPSLAFASSVCCIFVSSHLSCSSHIPFLLHLTSTLCPIIMNNIEVGGFIEEAESR